MSQRAHTKAELLQFWEQYKAAGYNIQKAARLCKPPVPPNTMTSRVRSAMARFGLKVPEHAIQRRRLTDEGKRLPEAVLRTSWQAFEAAEFNLSKAARAMGLSRGSMDKRIEACQVRLGLKVPDGHQFRSEIPLDVRQRQRFEDRIRAMSLENRKLARELNEAEDIRQAVFGLQAQKLEPPSWSVAAPRSRDVPGMPILFTSDFQWGEVIKGADLDNINEFDATVARRRYKLLIDKTIELAFGHMVRPKYEGMIYFRGGDMISGEIHADLRESNDLQSVPAVKDLVEHECAGIEALLRKFNKVHVVSVPGNHGRTTLKPQSKGYAERNMDTLSAWWLESYFKNEKRVTWQTPVSGDAIVPVYGYRFLLTHGDRIGSRGGQGFIGAVATITRGMKKVADYYASLGRPLDLQFIGHFHTSLELEYGFANGSLPGYSEYARDLRMTVQPPKQWLVFAHPTHMITARWPILLEPRPRLTAEPKPALAA
jgi:hypothetical protein